MRKKTGITLRDQIASKTLSLRDRAKNLLTKHEHGTKKHQVPTLYTLKTCQSRPLERGKEGGGEGGWFKRCCFN
jgi:hypothetical protein